MIQNIQTLENTFNSIINDVLSREGIYHKISTNVITYKKYSIIKNNGYFTVKLDNKKLMTCLLKITAFCYVKLHDQKNYKDIKEILELDKQYNLIYNKISSMLDASSKCVDVIYKNCLEDRIQYYEQKVNYIKKKISTIWYYSLNIETVFKMT